MSEDALNQAMDQLRLVSVKTRKAITSAGYVTMVEYHIGDSPNDAGHEESVHSDKPGITAEALQSTRRKAAIALMPVGCALLRGPTKKAFIALRLQQL